MRLYLDDDLASPLLAKLLRIAGHDVLLPADAGFSGQQDAVHLTQAILDDRVLLSRNYGDFESLHDLIMAARGRHPGILLVRRDNDPRRNMTHQRIARAIQNMLAAGVDVTDQCQSLNSWR
jgi:uncharacterized protein with PIN domain